MQFASELSLAVFDHRVLVRRFARSGEVFQFHKSRRFTSPGNVHTESKLSLLP